MTAAWALLGEARAAGVSLRLVDGRPRVTGQPSPDLLARLRACRVELAGLLGGDACRRCGGPMPWPEACGVTYGDGTAEHHGCRLLAAGARAVAGAVACSKEGELSGGEP